MDWLLEPSGTGGKLAVMVVAILLFVVVMGLILFCVDWPKRVPGWVVGDRVRRARGRHARVRPAVLEGCAPSCDSFDNLMGSAFVGVDNYVTAFTRDEFQIVLRNTAIWVIVVPLVSTFLGLVYAVVVDRSRFEKLAKTLIFLPMAISMVGAGIIWKFMYEYKPASQPQIGLFNQVLVWLGLEPQQFLLSAPANTLLILVMIWLPGRVRHDDLAAAIRAIPDDIVEAARLDGGGMRMFRYITVPSIRPALVVVLTTIAIGTLKVFDIVRTMTGGRFETLVVANGFYMQALRQGEQGLGAALAVILVNHPIIVYNVRQLKQAEEIR